MNGTMSGGPGRSVSLASLHLSVLLFGFAGLFGKWIELPAVWIVAGRTLFAAVALGVVLGLRRELVRPPLPLLSNGAVLAAHWVGFFEAIRVSSVAIGLLGYASFPLFVLLFERLRFRVSMTGRRTAIVLMVTCGLLLVVPEFSLSDRSVQGLLWGLVSGATFAWLAVSNRAAAAAHTAAVVAFWQNLAACICLLPLLGVVPASPTALDLALLAALGIVCTAGAHTLFIRALADLSAHTASVIAALEPVYGILLALLLLGEVPSVRTLAGGAVIVGAAMLVTNRDAGGTSV